MTKNRIGDRLEAFLSDMTMEDLPQYDREIIKHFARRNVTLMKWDVSRLSNEEDYIEAKKITSQFIKDRPYRNRENVIRVLNLFFGCFQEEWRQVSNNERFCNPDYDPYELDIKLLKYLQSGEDESRKLKRDTDIAEHFSFSTTKIHEHLSKLQNGINILGSRMQIKLRRGKNTYDSTVHPVFMALNLSEVYFLTVILKKYFPKDHPIFGKIADDITNDVYSQLSDYAKKFIDEKAEKKGIVFDKDFDYCQGYREESERWGYFLKGSCLCQVYYMDWGEAPKLCKTLSPEPNGIKVRIEETGEEIILDYMKIFNIKAKYD